MSDIGNKFWGFCHTLRHDGVDYGDYIEQLSYLLFLKMADEKDAEIPKKYGWASLRVLSGQDLLDHYNEIIRNLREQKGMVGKMFTKALIKISNPVNLKRLINAIDEVRWTELDVDVKGQLFEELLERSASEGKKGAGQYFTPRPLIRSIVKVMKPDPRVRNDFTICDPACGTGGFVVQAYEWLIHETKGGALDRDEAKRIRTKTYYGYELVDRPAKLAMMNLYLHGVKAEVNIMDTIYSAFDNKYYDCILTNPPFGTKGANASPEREDFNVTTSNKQLNFVQHIVTALKPGGRAAVVLPDNVLFEDKAGEVFELLMQDCNLHTILRLPRGTFTPYAQGVKANVIFFQKGLKTSETWIFDGRSNVEGITKKDRPLNDKHFEEFDQCYGKDANGQSRRKDQGEAGRFRKFTIDEIKARDYKLDIAWLKDESQDNGYEDATAAEVLQDTIGDVEGMLKDLKKVLTMIEK